MNKNSILAFLLIAATVIFFNSDMWNNFWYGTVLKRPVPTYTRQTPKQTSVQEETAANRNIPPQESTIGDPNESVAGDGYQPSRVNRNDGSDRDHNTADNDSTDAILPAVEEFVIIETNRIIATVSTKGGRIVSLRMKDFYYTTGDRKGEMIDLLSPYSDGGAQLSINNESFDDNFFSVEHTLSDDPIVVGDDPFELVLETKSSRGRTIQKVFTFSNDTYKIGYTVRGEGLTNQKVTLGWEGGIEESESGQGGIFEHSERRRAPPVTPCDWCFPRD